MENTSHKKGRKFDSGMEVGEEKTEGRKSARTGKVQGDQPQSVTKKALSPGPPRLTEENVSRIRPLC